MKEEKIGFLRIGLKPSVPEPAPKKRFMVWIGPVMLTIALGLGTSEVILYPHLTARFGAGWLGLMALMLFFQTVWVQELARWVCVSGEHAVQGNARVLSTVGAIILITFFMFVAFVIPAWATASASALREIINWPADVRAGTVFWSYISFIIIFMIVFFSKVARKYIEHIATWSTLLAWIVLIISAIYGIKSGTLLNMFKSFFIWNIPKEMDWWVLGSTVAWVGAGPTLIWYTYWMKDAGWGMAGYVPPIPGWFGKSSSSEETGSICEKNGDNLKKLKTWILRSHFIIWVGYFLGSLFTILIFVGLSDSILRPQGLIPKGFDVVKHQANFFTLFLGKPGYLLFLLIAWLLLFNTQLTVAEALVRQNADITWIISSKVRKFFKEDIKNVYFIWWIIYLLISFILIGLQYFVKGANPFAYVTYAAMLSFISLLFSMLATFIGAIIFYRKGIIKELRPGIFWIIVLGIGVIMHFYVIIKAVMFFFKI